MPDTHSPPLTNSRIEWAYRERTPGSAALAAEARQLLPSGIAHDSRYLDPYSIYVARALGPHKWDVDGNRYIDFFGGHGSLILGHSHPAMVAAVQQAVAEGTQFAANHPAELAWVRAIQRLVPSAERVRFTSSGTEATLMAVRLARAFTGRDALVRFKGHFHGWHDHMAAGYSNHFDGTAAVGVLQGIADGTVLVAPGDLAAVEAALRAHDVAAVILEPTGASFGQVPISPEFLHDLRRVTEAAGTLLIFDEVITGFRVSPGGAQAAFGIRPDLSTFAKIVAGGMPGAAVAGRKDVLDWLDFDESKRQGREKIGHPGTFNANPVSAAAGIAVLGILAESDACARAAAMAAAFRDRMNAMLARERVGWAVYGTSSGFHLFMNAAGAPIDPERFDPYDHPMDALKAQPEDQQRKLRLALLTEGVDVNSRIGGLLSASHTEADVDQAVAAFAAALGRLRAEGELG